MDVTFVHFVVEFNSFLRENDVYFILNVQTETIVLTLASLAAVVMLACVQDTPGW